MAGRAVRNGRLEREPELPSIEVVQPRRRLAEDPEFYATVVRLRLAGHGVYRAGPNHVSVDGRRIASVRLRLEAQRRLLEQETDG